MRQWAQWISPSNSSLLSLAAPDSELCSATTVHQHLYAWLLWHVQLANSFLTDGRESAENGAIWPITFSWVKSMHADPVPHTSSTTTSFLILSFSSSCWWYMSTWHWYMAHTHIWFPDDCALLLMNHTRTLFRLKSLTVSADLGKKLLLGSGQRMLHVQSTSGCLAFAKGQ